MTQFTDIVQALVQKQDITEVLRSHLETAVNALLTMELTAFLDYEKYDRIGFNSGNSRNGSYDRTLHTEYGDLQITIPHDRILGSRYRHKSEQFHNLVPPTFAYSKSWKFYCLGRN